MRTREKSRRRREVRAAAGSGFDLGAEFEAEGFRDGVRGGFGGDEQDGWGHVWIVDSGWWLVVRR
jgi:hypothetical protein